MCFVKHTHRYIFLQPPQLSASIVMLFKNIPRFNNPQKYDLKNYTWKIQRGLTNSKYVEHPNICLSIRRTITVKHKHKEVFIPIVEILHEYPNQE